MEKSIEQTAVPPLRRSWELWFWWVLATVLAGLLSIPIGVLRSEFVVNIAFETAGWTESAAIRMSMIRWAVAWLVSWTGIGIAQWLVLRGYIPKAGWWVPATAVSSVVIWSVLAVMPTDSIRMLYASESLIPDALFGALTLTIMGGAQWLVLRRKVHKAGWWVPATAVSGGVSILTLLAIAELMAPQGVPLGMIMGFVVYCTLTGIALMWLLHPTASQQRTPVQAAAARDEPQAKRNAQAATEGSRQSRVLWTWWVLATTLGVVVGAVVGLRIGGFVGLAVGLAVLDNYESPLVGAVAMVVGGAVFGIVLGAAQWQVLQRYIPLIKASWWVLVTMIGGTIGGAIIQIAAMSARGAPSEGVVWAVLGVGGGAAIGGAQMLVLRRYLRTASWWLLVNSLAFAVGGAAGGVVRGAS